VTKSQVEYQNLTTKFPTIIPWVCTLMQGLTATTYFICLQLSP